MKMKTGQKKRKKWNEVEKKEWLSVWVSQWLSETKSDPAIKFCQVYGVQYMNDMLLCLMVKL